MCQEKVYKYLEKNKKAKFVDMLNDLGLCKSTIYNNLKRLRRAGQVTLTEHHYVFKGEKPAIKG